MTRYKPYPRYKDSGVEWLGKIPEGWEVKRMRNAARINPPKSEIEDVDLDDAVSFVPMESIGENGSLNLDIAKPFGSVYQGFTYFREGDVIVAKITPCFENGKGAIAENLRNSIGFGTTELHVFRPRNDLDRRFLFYLTASLAFRQPGEAWMYGAGGQKRVPDDFVLNFKTGFPSADEQLAIVEFLDRETAKIDNLITNKDRLIELLEEKRAALITHAVTRGLNRDAPLRDSGIEWLGRIPVHWEVRPLKRCGRIVGGTGFPHEYQGIEGEALPFYKVAELGKSLDSRTLTDSADSVSFETAAELGADIVPANAIVYAKIGAALLLNRRRLTTRPCCIDNNMSAFIPEGVNAEWSLYWMSILDFRELSNPGAVPSLSEGYQETLPFAVPPDSEQAAITDELRRKTDELSALSRQITSAIDRLQEYRAALIAAAVTGKIDVRNEVKAAA